MTNDTPAQPESHKIPPLPFGACAPIGMMARLLLATREAPDSWPGKRWAFMLRAAALRRLHGAPVDTQAFGANMRLLPDQNICEKRILFTPQYFDVQERQLLAERIKDDFIFIDAGANIGGYSLFVAALGGPQVRILAIEPQPEIFERLIFNIRANAFANIKAIACALSDRRGEVVLFVDERNNGGTSMRIVRSGRNGPTLRVPAIGLKDLVDQEGFSRIDALKIDIEGAEDLVLEPFLHQAPATLWPKLLFVGRFPKFWALDLPGLLTEKGYREILRTRSNIAYERDGTT